MTEPIPRPDPLTSTTLFSNMTIRGLQMVVAGAYIKYAQGSLNLDAGVHLAFSQAAVLKVDRDLLYAVAQPLSQVAHLNLEYIAVGANMLQSNMLQSFYLPAFET